MDHLDPDQIVILALGERGDLGTSPLGESGPVDPEGDSAHHHLQTCEVCRHELAQFTRTVDLAREGGALGLQTPLVLPASIWSGIAEELGVGNPVPRREPVRVVPDQRDGSSIPRSRHALADHTVDRSRRGDRPVPWRRALVAAAAVVVIGGAVAAGVAIGRPAASPVAVDSQAALMPMPAGPSLANGTATVTQNAAGLTLNVNTRQLPLRQGYYEVWLYNPTANQMVAVGTLGSGGNGLWTLATSIDLRSYSVVDVSAQDFDGNPAHKDSVLRGTLTQ